MIFHQRPVRLAINDHSNRLQQQQQRVQCPRRVPVEKHTEGRNNKHTHTRRGLIRTITTLSGRQGYGWSADLIDEKRSSYQHDVSCALETLQPPDLNGCHASDREGRLAGPIPGK